MDDNSHYGPDNTYNGAHSCDSIDCMTAGLTESDRAYISYAAHALMPYLEGSPIRVGMFRDADGLYVLLMVPDSDYGRAIVGAIYAPGMLARMAANGYTLTGDEIDGGVN